MYGTVVTSECWLMRFFVHVSAVLLCCTAGMLIKSYLHVFRCVHCVGTDSE